MLRDKSNKRDRIRSNLLATLSKSGCYGCGVYVCVCVCVCVRPRAIKNYSREMKSE